MEQYINKPQQRGDTEVTCYWTSDSLRLYRMGPHAATLSLWMADGGNFSNTKEL